MTPTSFSSIPDEIQGRIFRFTTCYDLAVALYSRWPPGLLSSFESWDLSDYSNNKLLLLYEWNRHILQKPPSKWPKEYFPWPFAKSREEVTVDRRDYITLLVARRINELVRHPELSEPVEPDFLTVHYDTLKYRYEKYIEYCDRLGGWNDLETCDKNYLKSIAKTSVFRETQEAKYFCNVIHKFKLPDPSVPFYKQRWDPEPLRKARKLRIPDEKQQVPNKTTYISVILFLGVLKKLKSQYSNSIGPGQWRPSTAKVDWRKHESNVRKVFGEEGLTLLHQGLETFIVPKYLDLLESCSTKNFPRFYAKFMERIPRYLDRSRKTSLGYETTLGFVDVRAVALYQLAKGPEYALTLLGDEHFDASCLLEDKDLQLHNKNWEELAKRNPRYVGSGWSLPPWKEEAKTRAPQRGTCLPYGHRPWPRPVEYPMNWTEWWHRWELTILWIFTAFCGAMVLMTMGVLMPTEDGIHEIFRVTNYKLGFLLGLASAGSIAVMLRGWMNYMRMNLIEIILMPFLMAFLFFIVSLGPPLAYKH